MARRRRYNPSQKRDYHGRWAAGSLSGSQASGASNISRGGSPAVRAATGNTRRYDAYLAKQAEQKAAARKTTIKRVATGAAILAAAGTGAYLGSRNKSSGTKDTPLGNVAHFPVKSETPKVPVVGNGSTPKKMEVSASTPRKVSPAPVVSKAVAGTTVVVKKPVAKANPTASPVATPVTSGVSSVKAEGAMVSLVRKGPKPKSNPSGNPVPTPGALVTEDGQSVKVVKGLNDAERIRLENNAVNAARKLADMEKKAGVNVGSTARRDFDKKNKAKRTKSEAAKARKDEQAAKRRKEMSKHIQSTMGVQAVAGSKMSSKEKAEARYATILENMMDSGTALNRKQRTFLKDYFE